MGAESSHPAAARANQAYPPVTDAPAVDSTPANPSEDHHTASAMPIPVTSTRTLHQNSKLHSLTKPQTPKPHTIYHVFQTLSPKPQTLHRKL